MGGSGLSSSVLKRDVLCNEHGHLYLYAFLVFLDVVERGLVKHPLQLLRHLKIRLPLLIRAV